MEKMLLGWGCLIVSVLFNAFGVFVIKLRLNEIGPLRLEGLRHILNYFCALIKSPLVVSAILLFFLAPLVFIIALSRMEISIAYPAQVGLNFVLVILFAFLFLGEAFTFFKVLGIGLILMGMFFLQK